MSKWFQKLLDALKKIAELLLKPPTTTTTTTASGTTETTTQTTTPTNNSGAWPSYRFDKYFGHGYSSENDDRINAMNACRAAGLNCIRCSGIPAPNDELAVHLLHFRSPVDGEFKLGKDNWYNQGLVKGVTRYQIVIDYPNASRWNKLIVDYPVNTVQFMTSDVAGVSAVIKDRPVIQKVD